MFASFFLPSSYDALANGASFFVKCLFCRASQPIKSTKMAHTHNPSLHTTSHINHLSFEHRFMQIHANCFIKVMPSLTPHILYFFCRTNIWLQILDVSHKFPYRPARIHIPPIGYKISPFGLRHSLSTCYPAKDGSHVVRLGTKEIKARNIAIIMRNGTTPHETSAVVALPRFCKIKRFNPSGGDIRASSMFTTIMTANHSPL